MNWICPLLAASFVVGLLIASFFVIFRGRRKASGNSNQPGLTSNLESKVAFDHIVLSKIFQKPRRQKVLFGSNMDNVDNELEAPQLSLPTLLLDGVPGRRLKLPELEPLSPDDLLQPQSRPLDISFDYPIFNPNYLQNLVKPHSPNDFLPIPAQRATSRIDQRTFLWRRWQSTEDESLQALIADKGVPANHLEWLSVAQKLGTGRSPKQCRERWQNHLAPGISRDPWTPEEDERLLELQARSGNNWSCFLPHFPGRSYASLKNRFYTC